MSGKIIAGGRIELSQLSESFDNVSDGDDLVMIIKFDNVEEYSKANRGIPTLLEWDYGEG